MLYLQIQASAYMKTLSINLILIPLFLVSFLFGLASCTNNPDVKDDDAKAKVALVGVWRGEGSFEDEADVWKIIRQADGTYVANYLVVHNEKKLYVRTSDEGTWGFEDGVYYEINSSGNKTIYTVSQVKKDYFEYNIEQNVDSDNIHESKTVDDFQLQGPPDGYSEVSHEQPTEVPVEAEE